MHFCTVQQYIILQCIIHTYIHAYIVFCFNKSDVFIICVRNSSRRIPHTQTFDPTDPLHTAFVETISSLRRRVLGGGGSSIANNSSGSSTVEDNLFNPVNHTLESYSSHTFERENLTEAILQSITHSAGSVGYWQLQQYRAQPEDFEKVGTVIYIYIYIYAMLLYYIIYIKYRSVLFCIIMLCIWQYILIILEVDCITILYQSINSYLHSNHTVYCLYSSVSIIYAQDDASLGHVDVITALTNLRY